MLKYEKYLNTNNSKPQHWPFILTFVQVWKTVGMQSIVFYAALMGIDETLFEAARIDGATKWTEGFYND